MKNNNEKFNWLNVVLSIDQTITWLGISRTALTRYTKLHQIPFYCSGGRTYYFPEDVDTFEKRLPDIFGKTIKEIQSL